MTETAPRISIETPNGTFAADDPRAAQAIAAYVRGEIGKDLARKQVNQINAALILAPQEGVCTACQRRLPLFLYRCEHWEVFGFSHAHQEWLCTRDLSRAAELAEDDKRICAELPDWLPENWDPFTAHVPGTAAFAAERAKQQAERIARHNAAVAARAEAAAKPTAKD
jgi:hypothetical protein